MHMPVFTDSQSVSQAIGGTNYEFSATRIEDLGASEYTLGLVVLDVSGSTSGMRPDMEKALKAIVAACRKNPRADNMMLRVVKFDDMVDEIHGFKPLPDCNESDYDGCLGRGGGLTALFDACYTGIKSATIYGDQLTQQDFDVNAALFVVTDGGNNRGAATEKMVKEALEEAVTGESLESITSVLIGLNAGGGLDQLLKAVKDNCGFSQYVSIADATANQIAKLGDFISRSVSSQSQSLGTGGPSQSLAF